MKRVPICILLAAFVLASLTIGCRDENDPEYWLDQMHERAWREKSLKTLKEIYSKTLKDNKNDYNNANVQEIVTLMGPKLIEGFDAFTRDPVNRTEILKLLAVMKYDKNADIFLKGLDLKQEGGTKMFPVAANSVQRLNMPQALPSLLKAHDKIVADRNKRPGAPFTAGENVIEQSVITAASAIAAKHPTDPQTKKVVKMLGEVALTEDTLQDLRLNMKALKGLGRIGDVDAIPVLIKGIAMKGKKRPIGLGQFAFTALQQIRDRDAVIAAVLKFGKFEDEDFKKYFEKDIKTDKAMSNICWYRDEAAKLLGLMNYPSKEVIDYLMAELNHTEPDAIDEKASKTEGLPMNFEPDGWATMRRNWAAVALAQIGHKPLIPVIKERMVFKKEGRGKKARQVMELKPEEAVGYVRALGVMQDASGCPILLQVAQSGGDSLRDKTLYNASLMCGGEFTDVMNKAVKKIDCEEIVEQRFPDGSGSKEDRKQATNECNIMKKRIEGYRDRVKYGVDSGTDIKKYAEAISKHGDPNAERAIYSVYRIGRDDESKRAEIVKLLSDNLNNPSKVAITAAIYSLDHLTPQGDKALVERIKVVYKEFHRQSTYKDRARMLEAFIGRVRNRGATK